MMTVPQVILVPAMLLMTMNLAASELPASLKEDATTSRQHYRADLEAFRAEFGGSRHLPEVPFFQFGMGPRTKYLYKNGQLIRSADGKQKPTRVRHHAPTHTSHPVGVQDLAAASFVHDHARELNLGVDVPL